MIYTTRNKNGNRKIVTLLQKIIFQSICFFSIIKKDFAQCNCDAASFDSQSKSPEENESNND